MTVAYENSESVRLMVEEMVDTFHPTVKSEVKDKQYAREIEKILRKKVAGSGNELWNIKMM